ncbi:MAG: 30S ribosome-binding factor RbfA [Tatlockia sp.]|nr:30S ribosome-binding factor RbfA [Tatlockia sp.]
MTNEFKRTDRIAEMMQRKLSQLIQQEIKDPRLPAFVTISTVKVASDLSHAKVYFTVLNADVAETKAVLDSAAPYLRKALARSVKLRTVPQLHFVYDESVEYGRRLSRLIDELTPPDSENDEQS